ncbi:MAG: DUF4920 domain-containing protein [Phycisphaerales bacterium]|nr:DUF4920 domain-containing protein [Phycisphaerales bacterium]
MFVLARKRLGLLFLFLGIIGCAPKYAQFGEPMAAEQSATVAVADVLADPQAYDGKHIRLTGVVDSVCAAKGCWIRIAPPGGGDTVFVKFTCPVDGRLVPMEAKGHNAVVEGTLTIQEISQEEARHYKEDAGAPASEIEKIVGPQKTVRMQSPSARIEGLALKSS